MNACTQFHGNLFSCCWDISAWTEVDAWLTDRTSAPVALCCKKPSDLVRFVWRCFVDSGCCWGAELKFLIKGFFFPFSFWEVLSLAQLNWLPVELLPIKYKRINPRQNANLFRVQSGSFFCNNEQMCVTRELCNLYKAEVKKKGGEVNIRRTKMLMLCFYVPFQCVFMWMQFVWMLLCVY